MTKKKKKSVPFEPELTEDLKDINFAAGYLTEVFHAGGNSDEDFEVLFNALEKILQTQGIKASAKKMDLTRDALYKAFKKHHNPKVKNFRAMLHAADMELAFVPRKRA